MFRVLSDLRCLSMRLESSLPRGFPTPSVSISDFFSVRSAGTYVGLIRSVYRLTPVERTKVTAATASEVLFGMRKVYRCLERWQCNGPQKLDTKKAFS
jgi:hypothetical protein